MSSDESNDSDIESESSDDDSTQDDSYMIDIEESSEKRKYSDPDEEKYGQKIFISNIVFVTTSKNDDPILMESEGHNLSSFFIELKFDQGWGRRNDRFDEPTLYGDTYINPYKD